MNDCFDLAGVGVFKSFLEDMLCPGSYSDCDGGKMNIEIM
jgi:hypothetical protein